MSVFFACLQRDLATNQWGAIDGQGEIYIPGNSSVPRGSVEFLTQDPWPDSLPGLASGLQY